MSSDYNSISQFFSHPLVLLLIGAAISGVLIPYFTNRAAKYQKGLEIKTDLVRRINESVMRMVMSMQSVEVHLDNLSDVYKGRGSIPEQKEKLLNELEHIRNKQLDQKTNQISKELEEIEKINPFIQKLFEDAENEYRQWEVSSAVIKSQIGSYFPQIEAKRRKLTWSVFSDHMDIFYANIRDDVDSFLNDKLENRRDYHKMRENVLKEMEEIVADIRYSSVVGLSEDLYGPFITKIKRPYNIFTRKITQRRKIRSAMN